MAPTVELVLPPSPPPTVPKFKLSYFGDGIMSRGLATVTMLECCDLDYELKCVTINEFFVEGAKANFVWQYMPEIEMPDGTKFTELGGFATWLGAFAPKGNMLRVDDPGEHGISIMIAMKGAELFSTHGPHVPSILSVSGYTPEMAAKEQKSGETYVKPNIKVFEGLCSADGKFTSTGTSFGEIVLWGGLHQLRHAKATGCDPLPPNLTKFVDRLDQLPQARKVLDGQSGLGTIAEYLIPIPDEIKSKMPPDPLVVKLVKGDAASWGMTLDWNDANVLKLTGINEGGLVDTYNKTAEFAVKAPSIIESINGKTGSSEELMQLFRDKAVTEVELTLKTL